MSLENRMLVMPNPLATNAKSPQPRLSTDLPGEATAEDDFAKAVEETVANAKQDKSQLLALERVTATSEDKPAGTVEKKMIPPPSVKEEPAILRTTADALKQIAKQRDSLVRNNDINDDLDIPDGNLLLKTSVNVSGSAETSILQPANVAEQEKQSLPEELSLEQVPASRVALEVAGLAARSPLRGKDVGEGHNDPRLRDAGAPVARQAPALLAQDASVLDSPTEDRPLPASHRTALPVHAARLNPVEVRVLGQEKHLPPVTQSPSAGWNLSEPEVLNAKDPVMGMADRLAPARETRTRNAGPSLMTPQEEVEVTWLAKADVPPAALDRSQSAQGPAYQAAKKILSEIQTPHPSQAPNKPGGYPATIATGGDGVRTLTVGLEPASLGTLNVHLTLRGQELSVRLTAESQSALEAIDSDRDRLEAVLKSAGYSIEELRVHRVDAEQARTQLQDQQLRGDGSDGDVTAGGGDENAESSEMRRQQDSGDDGRQQQSTSSEDELGEASTVGGRSNSRAVVV